MIIEISKISINNFKIFDIYQFESIFNTGILLHLEKISAGLNPVDILT